jgi:hypothetical protein
VCAYVYDIFAIAFLSAGTSGGGVAGQRRCDRVLTRMLWDGFRDCGKGLAWGRGSLML